jgi:hypothetical protein
MVKGNFMRKLPQSTIVRWLLALMVSAPLHAQTARNPQAATDPAVPSTKPAGQAPDEVMKKLSDVVHAGKYEEAQQLTSGLLVAYPTDQRLIKAKALLDKSLANAAATTTTPGSNPAVTNETSTQLAANEKGGLLTGMDKVDYNALIELARQAQQNTDLEQQKASLKQFMDESSPFLQKHPTEILLWQLRAASAISLDDPMAGYEAGQKLLAMGAADSNDSNLQRLLAQLKNKGWMDRATAEKHAKYDWIAGTWSVSWSDHFQGWLSSHDNPGGAFSAEFLISGRTIEGRETSGGVKYTDPSFRGKIPDSGEVSWEVLVSSNPDSWAPPISWVTGDNKKWMTVKVTNTSGRVNTFNFTKIDALQ